MELMTRDFWVQYTDKDGRTGPPVCHRVWDSERFMAARVADAAKEGGAAKAVQVARPVLRKPA